MKRITALLLLLIGLTMLAACADLTTAKGTVDYFLEHLKRGNVEEAAKTLHPEEFAAELAETGKDLVEVVVLRQVLSHAQTEVGNEQVTGDQATVDIKLTPITGEAMQELRQQLEPLRPAEGEEFERDQVMEQMMKLADETDWEAFPTFEQTLRYHLLKQGDRWKIVDYEEIERDD